MADLERAAPLYAIATGQTAEEVTGSLRHLRDLGLMQVRCDTAGQQQFRVRTDYAARMLALLDDYACASRNQQMMRTTTSWPLTIAVADVPPSPNRRMSPAEAW
jgi:hypothetical protein